MKDSTPKRILALLATGETLSADQILAGLNTPVETITMKRLRPRIAELTTAGTLVKVPRGTTNAKGHALAGWKINVA